MRKNFFSLALMLAAFSTLLFFASSCKKEKHDHGTVTITINKPTANQEFDLGDTVRIEAILEGEHTLHGYEVKITKVSDGSLIKKWDKHTHSKTINVNEFWVNDLTNDAQLKVEVAAEIDHDGKKESKEVLIFCHDH